MGNQVRMRYIPSIGSLAFPIGFAAYSAYRLVRFLVSVPSYSAGIFPWAYIAGVVLGGALPVVLTFTLKIETAEYFLPRLVFLLAAILANSVPRQFAAVPRGYEVLVMAFISALTLLYFYKPRPARFSEWSVIALSTPTIYLMVYSL